MAMEAATVKRVEAGAARRKCGRLSAAGAAQPALTTEQERVLLEHLPIVRFLARRIHERLLAAAMWT